MPQGVSKAMRPALRYRACVHFNCFTLIPFHFAGIQVWRLDCNMGDTYAHVHTKMAEALMLPAQFIVLLTWAFQDIKVMSAQFRHKGRAVLLRAVPSRIAKLFNEVICELKGWPRYNICRVCAGFHTHFHVTETGKKRARPNSLTDAPPRDGDDSPRSQCGGSSSSESSSDF